MGLPTKVADEVLVRCNRHCCLCGKFVGTKIELHHIKQVADGGDDSADNCIPLCFNCHAEVKAYNPSHPKGRRYAEQDRICPLNHGDLVLVAGYAVIGKSAYLYYIVNANLQNKQRVGYCCIKDKPFNIGVEIIAEKTCIDSKYIKYGMITEDDYKKIDNSRINDENLALEKADLKAEDVCCVSFGRS